MLAAYFGRAGAVSEFLALGADPWAFEHGNNGAGISFAQEVDPGVRETVKKALKEARAARSNEVTVEDADLRDVQHLDVC